jgi:hypothetical protein
VSTPSRRAATAIAAVALVLAVSLIVREASAPVAVPSDSSRGSSRAIKVVPPDQAVLDAPPRQLSWSALEPSESYRVALYDWQSTPIWESEPTEKTSIAIPDSIRQAFGRNRPVYWRIIARDGVEHYRSELFQFVIRGD